MLCNHAGLVHNGNRPDAENREKKPEDAIHKGN